MWSEITYKSKHVGINMIFSTSFVMSNHYCLNFIHQHLFLQYLTFKLVNIVTNVRSSRKRLWVWRIQQKVSSKYWFKIYMNHLSILLLHNLIPPVPSLPGISLKTCFYKIKNHVTYYSKKMNNIDSFIKTVCYNF